MIKKLWIVVACLFSISTFACTKSLPTNNPKFCSSFKKAATCYCVEEGLPEEACQDLHELHKMMVGIFGTIEAVCENQSFTNKEDCENGWNCYINGGTDSAGRACASTGLACTE